MKPTRQHEPLHKHVQRDDVEDLLGGMDDAGSGEAGRQFINMEAAEADGSDDEQVEIPPTGHFDPIADPGKLFGEKRQFCYSVL